jgi:thiol peroxidase
MNVFPSIDTPVCATSVRKFNETASNMENTVVLCISKDLPFAHKRFCSTEELENVLPLSMYKNDSFGKDYGLEIVDGPLSGLFSRAIVVVGEDGKVLHSEQVGEIADEPNYDAAIAALS